MGYKVKSYFFKDFFWQKLVRISQKFIENVHEHYQNNYFRMAFLNISRNKFLYPDTLFVILIKCLKCDFLHEFYTLDLCIGKLNTIFSVGVVGLSSKNIEPIIVYSLTNIWKLAICSQQIKTWNIFFFKLALTWMFIYPVTVFFQHIIINLRHYQNYLSRSFPSPTK